MAVKFSTSVVSVGEMAQEFFDAGIIVLFGTDAPEELGDVAVVHDPDVPLAEGDGIAVGDTVMVAGAELRVLAVGDVANDNMRSLGHLVLKRNGADEAALPGDVCCDEGAIPEIAVGDRVTIESRAR